MSCFASLLLISLFVSLPAFAAMQVVESDDKAKVKRVEPAGTRWVDKSERWSQFPMDFTQDKPLMASGNTVISSGYGYGAGPGTGAELVYTFNGQKSVSVAFICHALGQIGEVYLDDKKVATVDTVAAGPIEYSGLVGQMREICVAADLSPGQHTLKIRNTGTWSEAISKAYNTNEPNQATTENKTAKTYRGLGSQLVVDFIRTGDYAFGTIQGTLKDSAGNLLKHVRMTLSSDIGPMKDKSGKTVFFTDGTGFYSLSGIPAGTYTLTAKQATIIDCSLQVTVAAGQTLTKDIAHAAPVIIARPRLMAPTVVARGDSLTVDVFGAPNATGWTLTLNNPYKSTVLKSSASYGERKIWNGTRTGWQLTAPIANNVPLGLWDLKVSNAGGSATELKAVKITDTYEKSFYLVHLTDTHIVSRYVPANDDKFSAVLEMIDIVNPTLIALTGDFTQMSCTMQAYEERIIPRLMAEYNAPLFVSRGNHEAPVSATLAFDDWFWETVTGPLSYSVKMGPVRLFCNDVMQPSSKAWMQSAFTASQADATDKVRIIMEHTEGFHGFSPSGPPYPTVLLYGHGHADQYNASAGYPKIQTASGQDFRFRLVRVNRENAGNWSLGSVSCDGNNTASLKVAASLTDRCLKRTYQNANDGSATSNSVSIVNGLNESFEHALAKFVMAKGVYAVTGGTIMDSYDSDDGKKTIVTVELNAQAKATSQAQIAPRGATAAAPMPKRVSR